MLQKMKEMKGTYVGTNMMPYSLIMHNIQQESFHHKRKLAMKETIGATWKANYRLLMSIIRKSKKGRVRELWEHLLADPSQWWDHRFYKGSSRHPDFLHKNTSEALWLDKWSTPEWARTRLPSMTSDVFQRSSYSWFSEISSYVKGGKNREALATYYEMHRRGLSPNKFICVCVLKACANMRALKEGRCIHAYVIASGYERDIYVASSLVDMYAKCGSVFESFSIFKDMPARNVVSWNSMISGYVKCGDGRRAIELFHQMQQEDIKPTKVTLVGALRACASALALKEGRSIHAQAIRSGLDLDIFVGSSMIDMYARCGCILDAERVFHNMAVRNVVTWNSMIVGCVKCGKGGKALDFFNQMQREKVKADKVTYLGVLNACGSQGALEEGTLVHTQVIVDGMDTDDMVGNCLVDMYAKCGSMEDACRVLNNMSVQNAVAWNSLIAGYSQCGQGANALERFLLMQKSGVEPDRATFLEALNACASIAALKEGRLVHAQILKYGMDTDVLVSNCLVDMYAKCGSIKDARRVFDSMSLHDLVSWNTILVGYAMHGLSKETAQLFDDMCKEDLEVNGRTLVGILSSYSHTGSVDEGCYYFENMGPVYGVLRNVQSYSCMVDLLGRYGYLEDAEDVIQKMNCRENVAIWMTLLGACKIHGNVRLGELAAKRVHKLDPENTSAYVLLSNIYAATAECKHRALSL